MSISKSILILIKKQLPPKYQLWRNDAFLNFKLIDDFFVLTNLTLN